jgi:hypothetical protein
MGRRQRDECRARRSKWVVSGALVHIDNDLRLLGHSLRCSQTDSSVWVNDVGTEGFSRVVSLDLVQGL